MSDAPTDPQTNPPCDIAPAHAQQEVTRLLREAQQGGAGAVAELLPLVYERLRELARGRIGQERAGHTLQPTALVHEAYLRLVGDGDAERVPWADRAHFFFAAAEAMRRILVDHARARGGPRRGGGRKRVPLNSVLDLAGAEENSAEILAVDEAFSRLQQVSDSAAAVGLHFPARLPPNGMAAGVYLHTVGHGRGYARRRGRQDRHPGAPLGD